MMSQQSQTIPLISVVTPVYKEENNIIPFLDRIVPLLEKIGRYEIIFCMDPSPDGTERIIQDIIKQNINIKLLVMSRRFGQESATMAGIRHCSGNSCVTIDIDLQDPPELIPQMYARFCEGYDTVLMRRKSRDGETVSKKIIAFAGYRFINAIANVPIPNDISDFRLISRRVINQLSNLKEARYFMRGLIHYIGYKHSIIEYDRAARHQGVTHYNRYFGSLKSALDGIFGFSIAPLTAIWCLGLLVCIGSIILTILIGIGFIDGLTIIATSIFFLGGVQLIALGILGEYIGRIYDEVRARPNYIIDRAINIHSQTSS